MPVEFHFILFSFFSGLISTVSNKISRRTLCARRLQCARYTIASEFCWYIKSLLTYLTAEVIYKRGNEAKESGNPTDRYHSCLPHENVAFCPYHSHQLECKCIRFGREWSMYFGFIVLGLHFLMFCVDVRRPNHCIFPTYHSHTLIACERKYEMICQKWNQRSHPLHLHLHVSPDRWWSKLFLFICSHSVRRNLPHEWNNDRMNEWHSSFAAGCC